MAGRGVLIVAAAASAALSPPGARLYPQTGNGRRRTS